MKKPFAPVRGEGAGPRPSAVATPQTDAESGAEADSLRASLRALDAMAGRGLIPQEEYERRRAELISESRAGLRP